MANNNIPIRLTKAAEALRQESETFEQLKRQDKNWFLLRLIMGYCAIVLLVGILVISAIIIFNYDKYPDKIVGWAGPALFVDILGLIFTVWKVVLNPNFSTKLNPITKK
jgi:peptidoglycan biosynthesis protein MviN/MurJ (putative lipid II flippase)